MKECGEIGEARIDMKRHMDMCGKSVSEVHHTQEKRKEVCKHWQCGKCDRGTQCMFSHVSHQNISSNESRSTASASIPAAMALPVIFSPEGDVISSTP